MGVTDPANEEAFDPWKSPNAQLRYSWSVALIPSDLILVTTSSTSNSTPKSDTSLQRECGISDWGGERRYRPSPLPTQNSPQPLSPTRVRHQDSGTSNLSATPPSSLGSFQRLALTPSRPLDRQRPVLTPSEHAASTRSDLSPHRRPDPSGTVLNLSPYQSQPPMQTPSLSPQSNRPPNRARSEKVPNQHQAHTPSRGLPILSSSHQRDIQVVRATPPTPPVPDQLPDLDPRLAAITPSDSKLTRDRTCHPKTFF